VCFYSLSLLYNIVTQWVYLLTILEGELLKRGGTTTFGCPVLASARGSIPCIMDPYKEVLSHNWSSSKIELVATLKICQGPVRHCCEVAALAGRLALKG
jgi:hypothetical protein